MKVAIPRFGEAVAPCFEYSATFAIFTVEQNQIVDEIDFCLHSREALDRVRLLRDQGVDTLICGGVQAFFEDMLVDHRIQVISWVSGRVDELLKLFLCGQLAPGTGRLGNVPGKTVTSKRASSPTAEDGRATGPRSIVTRETGES